MWYLITFMAGTAFGVAVMCIFQLSSQADAAIAYIDQSNATAGGDIVGGNKTETTS